MADQRHARLIERIAEDLWNRGDLGAAAEIMADDATYHGPHMPGGRGDWDAWVGAIRMYRSAFPDAHVTFEELIDAGETVVGRWSATGTHDGPLPGLPPTGTRIAISGITIYRVAGGRVAEAWEQLDLLGMWQQLRVVSLPGHERPLSPSRQQGERP